MNKNLRTWIYSALFVALVALFTAFLKIPSPIGYMHLGDGVIFAAAAMFGPWAAVVAGVGSALADLVAGYPLYIVPTFLIKGLMGLVSGWWLARTPRAGVVRLLPVFALCEALMIAGYFIAEAFALSYGIAGAWSAVPFNLAQGGMGILLGAVLVPVVRKLKK